ncbi:hypothetical protein SUGI_0292260 [Cryptomeria japonica]|nr:hypothetical protein SUGI_0292260 [Cryptomeria japonica]
MFSSPTLSREEAANILDAASNPGGPPWRSSTQLIATDDQALALHSDVNFSGAPLSSLCPEARRMLAKIPCFDYRNLSSPRFRNRVYIL